MKRILIVPMSTVSHYYASFGLARVLCQLGYEVVYGGDARFEQTVEDNGFFLIHLSTHLLADNDKLKLSTIPLSALLRRRPERPSATDVYCAFRDELTVFSSKIDKLQPDYVFLDACLSRYAVPLHSHPSLTIILQLMLPTRKDQQVPPHNSSVVPRRGVSIKIHSAWQMNYRKNMVDTIVKHVHYSTMDAKRLLSRWAKEKQLPLDRIIQFRKSEVYDRILETHELSLTPNEFDFPWKKKSRYVHAIGPFIDTSRTLDSTLCDFVALRKNVLESNRFEKIVFCSFGTLSALRNISDQMMQRVIDVFKHKASTALIVSTGSNFSVASERKPDNVFLFEKVPQIQLLAYCDLMISHGGLNSVFECIARCVPMLLIPLSSCWDHPGICARVMYHRIGLMLTLRQSTKDTLNEKIDELLTNPLFQQRISRLSGTVNNKNLKAEVREFMKLISEET